MPIRYEASVEDDHIHVIVKGSLGSAAEMMDYIGSQRGELEKAGLAKLLIDETQCHMHLDFDALEKVASELQKPEWIVDKLKIAIVSSSINHPLFKHIFEPMEKIRIFTDNEKARQWLAGK